jgi:hypothetical protein
MPKAASRSSSEGTRPAESRAPVGAAGERPPIIGMGMGRGPGVVTRMVVDVWVASPGAPMYTQMVVLPPTSLQSGHAAAGSPDRGVPTRKLDAREGVGTRTSTAVVSAHEPVDTRPVLAVPTNTGRGGDGVAGTFKLALAVRRCVASHRAKGPPATATTGGVSTSLPSTRPVLAPGAPHRCAGANAGAWVGVGVLAQAEVVRGRTSQPSPAGVAHTSTSTRPCRNIAASSAAAAASATCVVDAGVGPGPGVGVAEAARGAVEAPEGPAASPPCAQWEQVGPIAPTSGSNHVGSLSVLAIPPPAAPTVLDWLLALVPTLRLGRTRATTMVAHRTRAAPATA